MHGLLFGIAPARGRTARLYLAIAVVSVCLWGFLLAYLLFGSLLGGWGTAAPWAAVWGATSESEAVFRLVIPILGFIMPIVSLIFTVEDNMGDTPRVLYVVPRRCCRIILGADIGVLGVMLIACGAAEGTGTYGIPAVPEWFVGPVPMVGVPLAMPVTCLGMPLWLVVLVFGLAPSIVALCLVGAWIFLIRPRFSPGDYGLDGKGGEVIGRMLELDYLTDDMIGRDGSEPHGRGGIRPA